MMACPKCKAKVLPNEILWAIFPEKYDDPLVWICESCYQKECKELQEKAKTVAREVRVGRTEEEHDE